MDNYNLNSLAGYGGNVGDAGSLGFAISSLLGSAATGSGSAVYSGDVGTVNQNAMTPIQLEDAAFAARVLGLSENLALDLVRGGTSRGTNVNGMTAASNALQQQQLQQQQQQFQVQQLQRVQQLVQVQQQLELKKSFQPNEVPRQAVIGAESSIDNKRSEPSRSNDRRSRSKGRRSRSNDRHKDISPRGLDRSDSSHHIQKRYPTDQQNSGNNYSDRRGRSGDRTSQQHRHRQRSPDQLQNHNQQHQRQQRGPDQQRGQNWQHSPNFSKQQQANVKVRETELQLQETLKRMQNLEEAHLKKDRHIKEMESMLQKRDIDNDPYMRSRPRREDLHREEMDSMMIKKERDDDLYMSRPRREDLHREEMDSMMIKKERDDDLYMSRPRREDLHREEIDNMIIKKERDDDFYMSRPRREDLHREEMDSMMIKKERDDDLYMSRLRREDLHREEMEDMLRKREVDDDLYMSRPRREIPPHLDWPPRNDLPGDGFFGSHPPPKRPLPHFPIMDRPAGDELTVQNKNIYPLIPGLMGIPQRKMPISSGSSGGASGSNQSRAKRKNTGSSPDGRLMKKSGFNSKLPKSMVIRHGFKDVNQAFHREIDWIANYLNRSKQLQPSRTEDDSVLLCLNCGRDGHKETDCKKPIIGLEMSSRTVTRQVKLLRETGYGLHLYNKKLKNLMCYFCDKKFSSVKNFNKHLELREHKKNLKIFGSGVLGDPGRIPLVVRLRSIPDIHSKSKEDLDYKVFSFLCRSCLQVVPGPAAKHIASLRHQYSLVYGKSCETCGLYFKTDLGKLKHKKSFIHTKMLELRGKSASKKALDSNLDPVRKRQIDEELEKLGVGIKKPRLNVSGEGSYLDPVRKQQIDDELRKIGVDSKKLRSNVSRDEPSLDPVRKRQIDDELRKLGVESNNLNKTSDQQKSKDVVKTLGVGGKTADGGGKTAPQVSQDELFLDPVRKRQIDDELRKLGVEKKKPNVSRDEPSLDPVRKRQIDDELRKLGVESKKPNAGNSNLDPIRERQIDEELQKLGVESKQSQSNKTSDQQKSKDVVKTLGVGGKTAEGGGKTAPQKQVALAKSKTGIPPGIVVGMDFVTSVSGWFCKVCEKFSPGVLKREHCSEDIHHSNLWKWCKKKNMPIAKVLEMYVADDEPSTSNIPTSTPEAKAVEDENEATDAKTGNVKKIKNFDEIEKVDIIKDKSELVDITDEGQSIKGDHLKNGETTILVTGDNKDDNAVNKEVEEKQDDDDGSGEDQMGVTRDVEKKVIKEISAAPSLDVKEGTPSETEVTPAKDQDVGEKEGEKSKVKKASPKKRAVKRAAAKKTPVKQ